MSRLQLGLRRSTQAVQADPFLASPETEPVQPERKRPTMTTTLGQPTPDHPARGLLRACHRQPRRQLRCRRPDARAAHAKGVVLTGHFSASPEAATVSRAGHLTGGSGARSSRGSRTSPGAPPPRRRSRVQPARAGRPVPPPQRRDDRPAGPLHQRLPRPHRRRLRRLPGRHRPRRTRARGLPGQPPCRRCLRARHPDPRRAGQLRDPDLLAGQRLPLPGRRRHREHRPLRLDPGRRTPAPRPTRRSPPRPPTS